MSTRCLLPHPYASRELCLPIHRLQFFVTGVLLATEDFPVVPAACIMSVLGQEVGGSLGGAVFSTTPNMSTRPVCTTWIPRDRTDHSPDMIA